MKPKITNKQLLSLFNLLNGLDKTHNEGYAFISNIATLYNPIAKKEVFLKYEKEYLSGGDRAYEYRIAMIDYQGRVTYIDDKFKDMFERYQFLAECVSFDIKDESSYEKTN